MNDDTIIEPNQILFFKPIKKCMTFLEKKFEIDRFGEYIPTKEFLNFYDNHITEPMIKDIMLWQGVPMTVRIHDINGIRFVNGKGPMFSWPTGFLSTSTLKGRLDKILN